MNVSVRVPEVALLEAEVERVQVPEKVKWLMILGAVRIGVAIFLIYSCSEDGFFDPLVFRHNDVFELMTIATYAAACYFLFKLRSQKTAYHHVSDVLSGVVACCFLLGFGEAVVCVASINFLLVLTISEFGIDDYDTRRYEAAAVLLYFIFRTCFMFYFACALKRVRAHFEKSGFFTEVAKVDDASIRADENAEVGDLDRPVFDAKSAMGEVTVMARVV